MMLDYVQEIHSADSPEESVSNKKTAPSAWMHSSTAVRNQACRRRKRPKKARKRKRCLLHSATVL